MSGWHRALPARRRSVSLRCAGSSTSAATESSCTAPVRPICGRSWRNTGPPSPSGSDAMPFSAAVLDDPAELTAEWLTAALGSQGHEVRVKSVTFERIGTGQIGASYRLNLEYAEGGSDLPSSLVAKIAAGSAEARARVGEGYRKEVRFY